MPTIAYNGSYSSLIRSEIMASLSTICRSAPAIISSVDLRRLYQMIPPASATTIRTKIAVMPRYVGHTVSRAVEAELDLGARRRRLGWEVTIADPPIASPGRQPGVAILSRESLPGSAYQPARRSPQLIRCPGQSTGLSEFPAQLHPGIAGIMAGEHLAVVAAGENAVGLCRMGCESPDRRVGLDRQRQCLPTPPAVFGALDGSGA